MEIPKLKCFDSIFCEFDAIVDTDMGVYRYLHNNFAGSKYFNYAFNTIGTDEWFLATALSRQTINPIVPISILSEDECDSLYKDLYKEESYKEILALSNINDLFRLMNTYIDSSDFNVTVLCRNSLEENIVKKYSNSIKTIVSNYKDVNTDNYNAYYMKYYKNLIEFKKFSRNQLYVLNYPFNMEKDNFVPLRGISYLIYTSNSISIVNPYINPKLPKG